MFLRKKYRHHIEPPKLNLTAMVDVFTVLLIFLLKSFASEGGLVAINQNLQLPYSTSKLPSEISLTIFLTQDEVFVQDQKIEESFRDGPGESLALPALGEALAYYSEQLGLSQSKRGIVTIQADRRVPFWMLQRVLFTANRHGYDHIKFEVVRRAD